MIPLIISVVLLLIIVLFIYGAIKKAPVRLTEEEKLIDAVRYEEKFSSILEDNSTSDEEPKVQKIYSPQPIVKEKLILSPKR